MSVARLRVAQGAAVARAVTGAFAIVLVTLGAASAETKCNGEAATRIAAWSAAPSSSVRPGTVVEGERVHEARAGSCDQPGLVALQKAIASTLADGGIVLLGEVHDNGEQHALRGALIAEAARGLQRKPAVVMEHFRANHKFVLDRFRESGQAGGADKLFEVTEWSKSGWPDAALFRPMIDAVLGSGSQIEAADPPKEMVRLVGRQGLDFISDEERESLGLATALPAPLEDALLTELEASHCGLMPKTAFGKLALAQRYRDAHQARAALRAAQQHGASILLAGNGHVRSDRAVPWHLRHMSKLKVLTVMLLEADPGKTDALAQMPRDPEGRQAADFVLLTPQATRPDPCVAMREMFSKRRK